MSSLCNIFFVYIIFNFRINFHFPSRTREIRCERHQRSRARAPVASSNEKSTRRLPTVEEDGPRSCFSELSIHRFFFSSLWILLYTNTERWKNKPSKIGRMRTEKFRRAWMHTGAVKKEITSEMEREVVNSSRRNHLEAARARKRIEELTGEFSLFREKVLSDDEDGTILMFRDRNTSSDDTLSSFPSSSSSSASSSSIIQTNFSFAKTTARSTADACVWLGAA